MEDLQIVAEDGNETSCRMRRIYHLSCLPLGFTLAVSASWGRREAGKLAKGERSHGKQGKARGPGRLPRQMPGSCSRHV